MHSKAILIKICCYLSAFLAIYLFTFIPVSAIFGSANPNTPNYFAGRLVVVILLLLFWFIALFCISNLKALHSQRQLNSLISLSLVMTLANICLALFLAGVKDSGSTIAALAAGLDLTIVTNLYLIVMIITAAIYYKTFQSFSQLAELGRNFNLYITAGLLMVMNTILSSIGSPISLAISIWLAWVGLLWSLAMWQLAKQVDNL